MKSDEVRSAALDLSKAERLALACELVESVAGSESAPSEEEWAEAWGSEIESRLREYERTGEAVPHDEVMAEARARLAALRR